nr:hypothetical protein 17 [Piscirickettsiaceae bacterium]
MNLTTADKKVILRGLRLRQEEIHHQLMTLENNDQSDSNEYAQLDAEFDHINVIKHKIKGTE